MFIAPSKLDAYDQYGLSDIQVVIEDLGNVPLIPVDFFLHSALPPVNEVETHVDVLRSGNGVGCPFKTRWRTGCQSKA
jgi:hypothetical protein